MPGNLHWETVTPLLKDALTKIMKSDEFQSFRLVGGTSLSLQLGHRISVDIDLFTDDEYGTVDFDMIDTYLRRTFSYVSEPKHGLIAIGTSYFIGDTIDDTVKLDLYYTDPFIQAELRIGLYRLATIEEITAMKIDIVQRKARKKDFWDIHELIHDYTPAQMIALHAARYPYHHDEQGIRKNFTDFSEADDDFDPVCLKGKYWELIKFDIAKAMQS